jgi:hypothetical protein
MCWRICYLAGFVNRRARSKICSFLFPNRGFFLLHHNAQELWAMTFFLFPETAESKLKTYNECNTECGYVFIWKQGLNSYKQTSCFWSVSLLCFLGNWKDMVLAQSAKSWKSYRNLSSTLECFKSSLEHVTDQDCTCQSSLETIQQHVHVYMPQRVSCLLQNFYL